MHSRWFHIAVSLLIKATLYILTLVTGTLGNSIAETAEGEHKLEIQSSAFILKIDRFTGGLAHLMDKESGRDLLAPSDRPVKLFEIAGESVWFTNNADALSSISATKNGTKQTLAIEYEFKTPAGFVFVSVFGSLSNQT